jgi:hypothetical protein
MEVSASGSFLSGVCVKTVEGCFDRLGGLEKIRLQNGLRRMDPFHPDKVSIPQLRFIAQKRGLRLTEVCLNWAKLQAQLSHPVLLVLRNGNVVVGLRADAHSNNQIVAFDPLYPTGQDFLLPQEVLESAWDGNAILVNRCLTASNLLAQFASVMPTFIVVLGFIMFWPTVTGEEYYTVDPRQKFQQQLGPEAWSPPNTLAHQSPLLDDGPSLGMTRAITVPPATGPDDSGIASALDSIPIARLAISKGDASTGLPNGEGVGTRHAPGAIPFDRDSELQAPKLRTFTPPAVAGLAAASSGLEHLKSIASPVSELAARSEAILSDSSGVEDALKLQGDPGRSAGAPEISALMARGDALFRMGDLVSARLFYERAADAGHGQAALRLGESYDPSFLAVMGIPVRGDAVLAARWYQRSIDLGVPNSNILLNALTRQ